MKQRNFLIVLAASFCLSIGFFVIGYFQTKTWVFLNVHLEASLILFTGVVAGSISLRIAPQDKAVSRLFYLAIFLLIISGVNNVFGIISKLSLFALQIVYIMHFAFRNGKPKPKECLAT